MDFFRDFYIKAKHPKSTGHIQVQNRYQIPSPTKSQYMPNLIYQYILETPASSYKRISNDRFTFHVVTYDTIISDTEISKAFMWLDMIATQDCSQTLNIYLYLTPFKKLRPREGEAILPYHINTGFTQRCSKDGEIVIYREEEWFKVFIHETIHNFNLDLIGPSELALANQMLKKAFSIPSSQDIKIYESYTEAWARIIATMFEALDADAVPTLNRFIITVKRKLNGNRSFYAYQMVKILRMIQSSDTSQSNVYAYYILAGILSVYPLTFIDWCCQGPRPGLKSIVFSPRRMRSFVTLLADLAQDKLILNLMEKMERKMDRMAQPVELWTTMRMTPDNK